MNMKKLIEIEANKLKSNIEIALNIDFPKPLEIQVMKFTESFEVDRKQFDTQFAKVFDKLTDDNCIYIISSDKLFKEWKTIDKIFSKQRERTHISKINSEFYNPKKESNITLYVGSKLKGTKTRLLQHLGLNGQGRSTYSLYIKDWMKDKTVNLKITIFKFKNIKDPLHLELLEDFLWEGLKPLFGKKGATFNRKTVK